MINKDFQVVSSSRFLFVEIGDLTWGTKAGKLPISTMSLKWLNLNFDKAADGEEEEEGEEQKKVAKKNS